MKKVIFGLVALTSMSAFANDCKVYFPKHDREWTCSNCENRTYERFDNKAIRALNKLGYSVTQNENERVDYILRRLSTKSHWETYSNDVNWAGSYLKVEVQLFHVSSGQKWNASAISRYNLIGSPVGAETRAMKNAVLDLPTCY